MDRLIEEMVALAGSHQAHRLCLFGSRARGDHRPDSDYDFALWGIPADRQPLFSTMWRSFQAYAKLTLFL